MKICEFLVVLMLLKAVSCYISIPMGKDGCPKALHIPCSCGKGGQKQSILIPVRSCTIQYEGKPGTRCVPCFKEMLIACMKFSNCESCEQNKDGSHSCVLPSQNASLKEIWEDGVNGSYNEYKLEKPLKSQNRIEQRNKGDDEESNEEKDSKSVKSMQAEFVVPTGYPIEVRVPAGGRARRRFVRQEAVKGCVPSFGFDTAEIHCWIWPDHTKCRETCIHGYKIYGRNEIMSKCFDKDPGVWKPHALGECTPYVNCQAELITPGNLTCYALTMEPPVCYISCKSYDENHELPRRKYTCNEEFDPPLPFCATLSEDFETETRSPEDID